MTNLPEQYTDVTEQFVDLQDGSKTPDSSLFAEASY